MDQLALAIDPSLGATSSVAPDHPASLAAGPNGDAHHTSQHPERSEKSGDEHDHDHDSDTESMDREHANLDPALQALPQLGPPTLAGNPRAPRSGPIRRTRTTRVARNSSNKKVYRSVGIQTGSDDQDSDVGPSMMPFVRPTKFIQTMPFRQPGIDLLSAALNTNGEIPDPPRVPLESCKRLRENGIDPYKVLKPPLGQPCYWSPETCNTVRIDWRPGDWERHLQTHLPDTLKAYWACPGCARTFNRKDSFKRHLKRPDTTCRARVDVTQSNEWETIYFHEPLPLS